MKTSQLPPARSRSDGEQNSTPPRLAPAAYMDRAHCAVFLQIALGWLKDDGLSSVEALTRCLQLLSALQKAIGRSLTSRRAA